MLSTLRQSTWILAATATLGLALPAHAWGDKEQGFVAGVATAVVVDQLFTGRHSAPPPPPRHQPAPPPQYYAPPQNNFVAPHRQKPRYVAPQPTVYQTPAAQAFRTYTLSERRQIQRQLSRAGYYGGAIDGTFGPGTYSAVSAWAQANGSAHALRATNSAYSVYDGLLF